MVPASRLIIAVALLGAFIAAALILGVPAPAHAVEATYVSNIGQSNSLARIHRWTARGQRKVGEGVTGAMIRARIRVDGKLEGDLQALLGHRRRPAEAVVSEMAG